MELTVQERIESERWRQIAFIIVRGIDAGIQHAHMSNGERRTICNAAKDASELMSTTIDLLHKGGIRETFREHFPTSGLIIQFLQHVPMTMTRDLPNIAIFLASMAKGQEIHEEVEIQTRKFMHEFHEFLHREMLKGEIPTALATSLEAAHG